MIYNLENKTVNEVVLDIHNSFDNAVNTILEEAKLILSAKDTDKAERMRNLGFINAKGVDDLDLRKFKRAIAEWKVSNITYLSYTYPQYKIIDNRQISSLCEKYNLIFGLAERYTGDIPDKNLIEIENFNVDSIKMEDRAYMTNHYHQVDNRFRIVAPIKEMIISEEEMKYRRMLDIPDPIVLFPLRNGYYIVVSKWGLEANDELLVNEKCN